MAVGICAFCLAGLRVMVRIWSGWVDDPGGITRGKDNLLSAGHSWGQRLTYFTVPARRILINTSPISNTICRAFTKRRQPARVLFYDNAWRHDRPATNDLAAVRQTSGRDLQFSPVFALSSCAVLMNFRKVTCSAIPLPLVSLTVKFLGRPVQNASRSSRIFIDHRTHAGKSLRRARRPGIRPGRFRN